MLECSVALDLRNFQHSLLLSQSTRKSYWLSCDGMLTKSNQIPLPQSYFARLSIDFPRPLCGNFGVAGPHTHIHIQILPIFMLYHNTCSGFIYVMNSFLARAMLSNYCVARLKINRHNHSITAQMRASRSSIVERGALEKTWIVDWLNERYGTMSFRSTFLLPVHMSMLSAMFFLAPFSVRDGEQFGGREKLLLNF